MLLSISNIAWSAESDAEMYAFLRELGYDGLEIAPTRIFPDKPYEHLNEARDFAKRLYEIYGLKVSSMQSIWYGRNERVFGTPEECAALVAYTKRAVDFAAVVGCENLVFGCPKNRNLPDETAEYMTVAVEFFGAIAEYAAANRTVIAIEPNPPFYGTNFINTTPQAFDFVRKVNSSGLKVNIDLGTMLAYDEYVSSVTENLNLVNHIHISEPKLVPIEKRTIHADFLALPFEKYASIEMANCGDIERVKEAAIYMKSICAKCISRERLEE